MKQPSGGASTDRQVAEHPGRLLAMRLEDMRNQAGHPFSQADLHRATGLSVQYLSALLAEKRGISARVALKLARFFGNDPMEWLLTQAHWDLEQARADLALDSITLPKRKGINMSSKYDEFWLEKFEAEGGIKKVLQDLRREKRIVLSCPDIRNWGDRRNWNGYSVISAEGKIGGNIMAHTAALKQILPTALAANEAISCRMTSSCDLILERLPLDAASPSPRNDGKATESTSRPDRSSQPNACCTKDLWPQALSDPLPLFLTIPNDKLVARLDDKGFFLSPEAQTAYKLIKDLPHLYVARLKSENWFYFGKSNQPGGRFKRAHAYHLGGLAHELLGTTREDDQRSHRFWLKAWFDLPKRDVKNRLERDGGYYLARLREPIVLSFLQAPSEQLRNLESALIAEAKRIGKDILNRTK